MHKNTEFVMEIGQYELIKITTDSGVTRFFAQTDGLAVTKEYPSIDGVRTDIELMDARKSIEWVSEWTPSKGTAIAAPSSILMYAVGKIFLLLITFGKYPPKGKHNTFFVSSFPGLLLGLAFLIITLVYS